jgi:hypothetical protein
MERNGLYAEMYNRQFRLEDVWREANTRGGFGMDIPRR